MSEEISNQTLHEILLRVETKVDKTNNRVNRLEGRDNFNRGGLCIIGALIVPIVIALAISLLN